MAQIFSNMGMSWLVGAIPGQCPDWLYSRFKRFLLQGQTLLLSRVRTVLRAWRLGCLILEDGAPRQIGQLVGTSEEPAGTMLL